MNRHQAVRIFVDVEELVLLLDEREFAVDAVAPAVVLAHELAAEPLRLLPRVIAPHEPVAAMTAGVVEARGAAPSRSRTTMSDAFATSMFFVK